MRDFHHDVTRDSSAYLSYGEESRLSIRENRLSTCVAEGCVPWRVCSPPRSSLFPACRSSKDPRWSCRTRERLRSNDCRVKRVSYASVSLHRLCCPNRVARAFVGRTHRTCASSPPGSVVHRARPWPAPRLRTCSSHPPNRNVADGNGRESRGEGPLVPRPRAEDPGEPFYVLVTRYRPARPTRFPRRRRAARAVALPRGETAGAFAQQGLTRACVPVRLGFAGRIERAIAVRGGRCLTS